MTWVGGTRAPSVGPARGLAWARALLVCFGCLTASVAMAEENYSCEISKLTPRNSTFFSPSFTVRVDPLRSRAFVRNDLIQEIEGGALRIDNVLIRKKQARILYPIAIPRVRYYAEPEFQRYAYRPVHFRLVLNQDTGQFRFSYVHIFRTVVAKGTCTRT